MSHHAYQLAQSSSAPSTIRNTRWCVSDASCISLLIFSAVMTSPLALAAWSVSHPSPVDHQVYPTDVAGLIRCQECDRGRDIIGLAQARERGARLHVSGGCRVGG